MCKSEKDKKSHLKYKKERNEKSNEYYEIHKEKINEKNKNNRPILNEKRKEYIKNNPEKIKLWKANYYQKHKFEINKKWAEKRRTNLDVRMANNLRARLNKALKGNHKTSSTIDLLGCSLDDLKIHLSKNFKDGMTWDNYGSDWHIDHIIPCFNFDLTDEVQQKICFNFANLQPLWRLENLKKNKY